MPIAVYDYRNDIRNVLITPEIRSRFLRMEPGEVGTAHTHDLGHEVFLILQGRCEFIIDGERAVLGPGQMCVALKNQMHQVRVVGDEPMTMYLSVTPHVQPTHTMWTDDGRRLPPRFTTWAVPAPDAAAAADVSTAELAERQVAASRALADVAHASAETQAAQAAALERAVASGDQTAVKAAMDGIWEQVYATFERLTELTTIWNVLASRAAEG